MRLRARKPEFEAVDGEYLIPLRLSQDLTHNLISGWHPIEIGWGHLRQRPDGSFDLFLRNETAREDMNMVRLDAVSRAVLSALDLALAVEDNSDASEELLAAAEEVKKYVSVIGE